MHEICYGQINKLIWIIKLSIYSKSFDALASSKEGSFVRSQEPPGELKGKMFQKRVEVGGRSSSLLKGESFENKHKIWAANAFC